jgi:lysophospholipase L1-like esterase
MSVRSTSALILAVLVMNAAAQERFLPKVVLIGDSIRLGYAPIVARLLHGKAIVVSPSANGEDSANVLRHLDEWVIKENPHIVHLNTGLHDLKLTDKGYQVPLAEYEKNLKRLVERIRQETKARIVFATTTPILDTLHAQRKVGFDRFEADVQKFNAAAVSIMKQISVPINDLHTVVERGGKATLMARDGTHYTEDGYETLAAAVANSILSHLMPPVGSR